MPWVKLDDGFWSEPKVRAVGNEAAGVFARMLSYCGQHLTDGEISEDIVRFITRRRQPLDVLVVHGLLERNGNGYRIPDYCDFNWSRSQIENRRKKEAERKAKSRGGSR